MSQVGVLLVVASMVAAGADDVRKVRLDSSAIALTGATKSDGSTYYFLQLSLPQELTAVRHAWLELRMDVSSERSGDFHDPVPVLDVFALNRPLMGDPVPGWFEPTRVPMSRPVAVGEGRLIKVEITEIVQKILADPAKNRGLVVGAVTAGNRGVFTMRPGDGAATIVIIDGGD